MFKDDWWAVIRVKELDGARLAAEVAVLRSMVLKNHNQFEIECAIDEIKYGCCPALINGNKGKAADSGSLSPNRWREWFWGHKQLRSVTEEAGIVSVRGKVPREFFEWLKDQVQIDWRNRKLLEKCFFEKW
jgi:hypothetical protein